MVCRRLHRALDGRMELKSTSSGPLVIKSMRTNGHRGDAPYPAGGRRVGERPPVRRSWPLEARGSCPTDKNHQGLGWVAEDRVGWDRDQPGGPGGGGRA